LRASGFVGEPEREHKKIRVLITFGGVSAPYALAVHEHLSLHSPWQWIAAEMTGKGVHWNVGGPKFLEKAINEGSDTLMARVAARIRFNELTYGVH
jgi:hypothetical protein